MFKFFATAAVAAALAAAGTATAAGPGGPAGNGRGAGPGGASRGHGMNPGGSLHNPPAGSHQHGGKPFSHGVWYPKEHFHWTYQCYSPRYGCNCYWCPTECCYYYWYQPAACYYPVTYIACAPAAVT